VDLIRSNSKFVVYLSSYFEERILPENIPNSRVDNAGIRSYGKLYGKLLEFFNFAVRLEAAGKIWYVNIKSLERWKAHQQVPQGMNNLDQIIAYIKKPVAAPMQASKPQPCAVVQQIAQRAIDHQGNKLVCFYKTGPTEFLGNFAICPKGLSIWGQRFRCAEAAFQWQKYVRAGIKDAMMNEFFTADGETAFRLNRKLAKKYPQIYPPGWKKGVRDLVMWEVLQAKFQQNPVFKQLLDDTMGAYLLEHNQAKRDDYWSDNSDGSGKNMLGKMLMALRDDLGPPPQENDASDAQRIQYFAHVAKKLDYAIF